MDTAPDSHAPEDRPQPHPKPVHIVVEVDGRAVPVTFAHSTATGREIREKAGAPLTDDLTRVEHGKSVGGNIGLDETIPIKDGHKFLAIPCGTVS